MNLVNLTFQNKKTTYFCTKHDDEKWPQFSKYQIDFDMSRLNEPRHEISNNVVCATSKGSDQPARIRAFASRWNILRL